MCSCYDELAEPFDVRQPPYRSVTSFSCARRKSQGSSAVPNKVFLRWSGSSRTLSARCDLLRRKSAERVNLENLSDGVNQRHLLSLAARLDLIPECRNGTTRKAHSRIKTRMYNYL